MYTAEGLVQPYVGISGVVSPTTQAELESVACEVGLYDQGRALALGVKAVHKTQFLDVGNKYGPEWYPIGEQSFTNALRHERSHFPTLAVAQTYLDVDHVADADYRKTFVNRIVQRGSPWITAIQFDMLPWHNDGAMLDFLEEVKVVHGLDILVQCHKNAMEELGPQGVVCRLGNYAAFVDYLLFDASHGTGTRLDVNALDSFLEEASSGFSADQTGLAVAGGLNAKTVREELPVLINKYPRLSWDAEGQLHPVNAEGKKPLDMPTVAAYLGASVDALKVS